MLSPASAHAERADRDKPVQIESDRMEYDETRRESVFVGRVVLTKGTIIIRGDRLVVREDAGGFRFARAEGAPASFRQKREGLDEFFEGSARTIDYDGRAESAVLSEAAQLQRLAREQILDQVQGARITYLSAAERYTVEGSPTGAAAGDRVRMVIQPRRPADPPASSGATQGARPETAAPLKPADRLASPPGSRTSSP